jgi:hypothetical protein
MYFNIPAPDDLKGWKEADSRLSTRFADHLTSSPRLSSARAVTRYFGQDDLEYFLQAHEMQGVAMAYAAWGVLDYRPNRTSRTQAQKMLAEGLPQDEAMLLRARMEAHPTIYRIAGHDAKAGTVNFEDVLLGGAVTVHDRLMSENIEDGLFIAARASPAGNFYFLELAGPPLGAGMGMDAVAYLRRCGMQFTRERLLGDAHMFGWLWAWIDQWQANRKMPRLCNMDGDDLLWHTASFSMADEQQVRTTLEGRPDVEYDEEAGQYVWSREAGNDPMPGRTTLGRIELLGDELVLTVNSAKRLASARKWLERLPGVAFKGVTTRQWNEREEDRPLDERIAKPEPVQMTPELGRAIQEMMVGHYMKWLDTPLPVLGGQTPRAACRTRDGREHVTMLIRTIPDPMGPGPVRVPRQAMLQELGLESEPASKPTSSPQGPPASPIAQEMTGTFSKKVGRNAPCPCGSGKKYKKCCGG